MIEIVVAGHLCLDVIPTFPDRIHDRLFEPGTLLEVGRPVLATGGAVSNVGLALHRLGIPSKLIGKVGDDLFGRAILNILRHHDQSLADDVIVSADDSSSYTIVLSPPGVDRIFLHAPGANNTFRPDEVDGIEGARIVHFGYPPIMEQTYADGGEALAQLFAGVRKKGAAVSLDMAQVDPSSNAARVDWTAFLQKVLPFVDVFAPSIGEILDMLGRTDRRPADHRRPTDGAALIDVADRLLEMGAAVVVLKLGTSGLFLRTSSEQERIDAVPGLRLDGRWRGRTLLHGCFDVIAVGTTGAGDCTLAGLLAAMLKGRAPEECLRDASAVGACSVEREDAASGVPSWEAVQGRVRSGWPLRPVEVDLSGWTWSDAHELWVGPL